MSTVDSKALKAHEYALYGWRVRADIALEPVVAGAPVATPAPAPDPDLAVSAHRVGPVPATQPDGVVLAEFPHCETCTKTYWLVANDAGFLLRFPGEVEYQIDSDIKHVAWLCSPGVPLEYARELFRGHGMALLLGLAGYAVFHSSAVVLTSRSNGASARALAVMGGSGAGKSTLAALLVAAGAKFLTDDLLCTAVRAEGVVVTGGCAELRLRKTASGLVKLFAGAPRRTTLDDRLAVTLGEGSLTGHRLGLLVFPELSDQAVKMTVSALRPREAAVRLAGSPRMSGWLLRRVLENQFYCLGAIATQVPAVRVELPWSDAVGEEQAEALLGELTRAMYRWAPA